MKRFLAIALLPIVFLFFGCTISSITKLALSKPLPSALNCKENERIIVQINKIKGPIVSNMDETKINSNDWVDINRPLKYETYDYGSEVLRQFNTAFRYTNLQELLLSHIQKKLSARSSCPLVYITSDDLKQVILQPSDRVVQISMYYHYYGTKPKLRAQIQWRLTNATNIPLIENKAQEYQTLIAPFKKSMAAKPSIPYMKQMIQKYNEIFTYCDAYATIVYYSPSHSRKNWLKDNGKLIIQETDNVLGKFSRQLAIALFPGERGKEDEPAAQRRSSPTTILPPSSSSLQPQGATESARNERGIISITTDPPGTKVFIDGEYKGQTPIEILLAAGTYQLFLEHQPYEPYKDSVMIEQGQSRTLDIKLSLAGKE